MSLLEKDFEQVIFEALSASPLYQGVDDRAGSYSRGAFSRESNADLTALAAFIERTQPAVWSRLHKRYPGREAAPVAAQINALRPKRGLLALLREGFELAEAGRIELVSFKPDSGMNPAHRQKYLANRFMIVRQFHYSSARPHDTLDLAILLNGLPLITIEVKNQFTGQTWRHAEAQYRQDRPAAEPFLKACVAHFAVDNTTISMTTQLANGKTRFLPFNRDTVNPPIADNFATAYLWEDVVDAAGNLKRGVLRADSLLDLLQHYLHLKKETDTVSGRESATLIFPRYHQLDCCRALLDTARAHGSGEHYLIQHSAGSGKSNTIAWLAHQLANLYADAESAHSQPVFDSVIIITDRQVLDKQLQDTVKQFEKTKDLVKKIDKNTKQLQEALADGKRIIVCTLQKFSFLRNGLGGAGALKGKKFALIVDEAHSSQSGDGAKDLKLALTSPESLQRIIDEDEENRDWDNPVIDELARLMKGRQRLPHLSFFAFTATPKTRTLELFGQPREVATDEGVKKIEHKAFHYYTMRQAIAEGFIFDVLQNYTTYGTYFELLENEKAPPGYEVETAKGRRLLMRLVGRHPHTIESKAKIMLDHFFSKTTHKINGEAKAMVVTSSRAHAVLYKQAIDRLLHEDYADQTKALVAFSGKVTLQGDQEITYTEEGMNPADARDIRLAFEKPKYRILIVANKFQTGFDQPLLHTMYVDKKLGGVATVQTLSRLNRKGPPAKLDTMVLDFVNSQESIEADFQDYYGKTTLDRGTDPQKLYNLKFEVEEVGVFTAAEVNEFAQLFIQEKAHDKKINALFTPIAGRFMQRVEEDQERFRVAVRRFVAQYAFISQIINWIDPELEKYYLFTKLLQKYLPPNKDALPEEILSMVDLDKFRLEEQQNGSIVLNPIDIEIENQSGDGHAPGANEIKDPLEAIVKELNDKFHFDFADRDKVMKIVMPKLTGDAALVATFQTNNVEALRQQNFANKLKDAFVSSADDFYQLLNRMSAEPDFKRLLTEFALAEFKRGIKHQAAAQT